MSRTYFSSSTRQPVDKLSKERPLATIFNVYVVGSILLQFAIHVWAFIYLTNLCEVYEPYVFLVPSFLTSFVLNRLSFTAVPV
jgi:cation-transporting ATPase 13A1